MKCFDRRKGTLNSFELEKYLSEFNKQKEYEKGLRSCAEKVNLSPPIIESKIAFHKISKCLTIEVYLTFSIPEKIYSLLMTHCALVNKYFRGKRVFLSVWFYYSERRMRWVRASLAINCIFHYFELD